MTDRQHSALVEAMSPRYVPEEETAIQIVSREAFNFIIEAAGKDDEFGAIGFSTFGCDKEHSYRAISIVSIHQVSPQMRDEWLEYRARTRERTPTPQQQMETDMHRADRRWRKLGRQILARLDIEPPHFLQTNWRAFNRIQQERSNTNNYYYWRGDLITYRDEDRKIWYVADDSENKFRHNK